MLVLYGSETGNAADLADVVVDRLRRRRLPVEVMAFGQCSIEKLAGASSVFVVCSTTGQGELPRNTRPLWSLLLRRSLPPTLFSGLKLFTFGLGSSAYPKFNYAARKIHARLLQLGATEALPRGEGDEIGSNPYELVFDEWLAAALSLVDQELPVAAILPLSAPLPPFRTLYTSQPNGNVSVQLRSAELIEATVLENSRKTLETHFQDVRLLRLQWKDAGISWSPGDAVSIYPQNDMRIVKMVMESQGWDPELKVWADEPPTGGWCSELPIKLIDLLVYHVDLNAIPRRQFFVTAAQFCGADRQKERMLEFASDLDDLFNYTSRPRRSIAEVILEFDSLKIPVEYILDVLPPLRPRQYSIANADSKDGCLDLCVAIVKYRTILRQVRRGLCTHYIQQLQVGQQLRVGIERGTLKLVERAQGRPLICVATGTGIAPVRALLQALGTLDGFASGAAEPHNPASADAGAAQIQANPTPSRILFYGCRGPTEDYLFGKELESYAKIVPAFSRHGGGYVQQQISAYSGNLMLEKALIYVCGSSGAMPRAVREAFKTKLDGYGLDGEAVLAQKERQGLYLQETW